MNPKDTNVDDRDPMDVIPHRTCLPQKHTCVRPYSPTSALPFIHYNTAACPITLPDITFEI
jgi:hypothetical protein